eukprot:8203013-Heterocapsa_arctica.AAC.1
MHESFVSELVAHKADAVFEQIRNLLSDDAFEDPAKWGRVWLLIDLACHVQEAKTLILTLVLQMAAEWHMRFVLITRKFPLHFLQCLAADPGADCPSRRQVACQLLDGCDTCLRSDLSDIGWKLKRLYHQDWQHMQATGQCTAGLFAVLLALRSVLHGETQEVEGWNNILQLMAKRSPKLGIALASARLNLKHGATLSPEDCCELHDSVVRLMSTDDFASRFEPLSGAVPANAVPPVDRVAPCCHSTNPVLLRAASLSNA